MYGGQEEEGGVGSGSVLLYTYVLITRVQCKDNSNHTDLHVALQATIATVSVEATNTGSSMNGHTHSESGRRKTHFLVGFIRLQVTDSPSHKAAGSHAPLPPTQQPHTLQYTNATIGHTATHTHTHTCSKHTQSTHIELQ